MNYGTKKNITKQVTQSYLYFTHSFYILIVRNDSNTKSQLSFSVAIAVVPTLIGPWFIREEFVVLAACLFICNLPTVICGEINYSI
jgi:hypothetical protein